MVRLKTGPSSDPGVLEAYRTAVGLLVWRKPEIKPLLIRKRDPDRKSKPQKQLGDA